MTLAVRLILSLGFATQLLLSGGADVACQASSHPAGAEAAHHGNHGPDAPTPHNGHSNCPDLPDAHCSGMAACLAITGMPAATLHSQVPRTVAAPLATPASTPLTRDLTPEAPPPRA